MVKQISDNEIYLLIKYIKSVLWRVAIRLSYIENAWCLKVNRFQYTYYRSPHGHHRVSSQAMEHYQRQMAFVLHKCLLCRTNQNSDNKNHRMLQQTNQRAC